MDLIGSWYDRFECSKGFKQGRLFPSHTRNSLSVHITKLLIIQGRGRIFISLKWVLLCALLRFWVGIEEGIFYFLEDGFVIKCIYGSSYYKLLFDVSSKKTHRELFLGSCDSPYTENARKVVVASVNLGGTKLPVKM